MTTNATALTNDGNSYLLNGKLYGRVNSDSTVDAQTKRLKELREVKGIQSQFFITCRNTVKIKWAGMFRDYEFMAKHFADYRLDVPLSV